MNRQHWDDSQFPTTFSFDDHLFKTGCLEKRNMEDQNWVGCQVRPLTLLFRRIQSAQKRAPLTGSFALQITTLQAFSLCSKQLCKPHDNNKQVCPNLQFIFVICSRPNTTGLAECSSWKFQYKDDQAVCKRQGCLEFCFQLLFSSFYQSWRKYLDLQTLSQNFVLLSTTVAKEERHQYLSFLIYVLWFA